MVITVRYLMDEVCGRVFDIRRKYAAVVKSRRSVEQDNVAIFHVWLS